MTYSDTEDYNPQEEPDFEEEPDYPTAFGITFTPEISGIALCVLGLFASGYILLTFVSPAYESYNTLKTNEAEKQSQVEQKRSGKLDEKRLAAESKLRESEALRNEVLSLFSNENTLRTLLFDVSKLLQAREVELVSFRPEGPITIVNDSSLGEGVNNRLKRQRFQLEVSGDFTQTKNLLRDLERLQPLLIIQGLGSALTEDKFKVDVVNAQQTEETIPQNQNPVKTTFTLDAILPLSPEEVAQLAPPPPAPGAENQPTTQPSP